MRSDKTCLIARCAALGFEKKHDYERFRKDVLDFTDRITGSREGTGRADEDEIKTTAVRYLESHSGQQYEKHANDFLKIESMTEDEARTELLDIIERWIRKVKSRKSESLSALSHVTKASDTTEISTRNRKNGSQYRSVPLGLRTTPSRVIGQDQPLRQSRAESTASRQPSSSRTVAEDDDELLDLEEIIDSEREKRATARTAEKATDTEPNVAPVAISGHKTSALRPATRDTEEVSSLIPDTTNGTTAKRGRKDVSPIDRESDDLHISKRVRRASLTSNGLQDVSIGEREHPTHSYPEQTIRDNSYDPNAEPARSSNTGLATAKSMRDRQHVSFQEAGSADESTNSESDPEPDQVPARLTNSLKPTIPVTVSTRADQSRRPSSLALGTGSTQVSTTSEPSRNSRILQSIAPSTPSLLAPYTPPPSNKNLHSYTNKNTKFDHLSGSSIAMPQVPPEETMKNIILNYINQCQIHALRKSQPRNGKISAEQAKWYLDRSKLFGLLYMDLKSRAEYFLYCGPSVRGCESTSSLPVSRESNASEDEPPVTSSYVLDEL